MSRLRFTLKKFSQQFGALVLVPPSSLRGRDDFRRDLQFQLTYGCSQAMVSSIAFIVIKQYLDGGDHLIALVQAGVMAGLLCSLIYSNLRAKTIATHAFAWPHIFGWACILLAVLKQEALWFAMLMATASFLFALSSPIQGVIYNLIYRRQDRGRIVGLLKQWQTLAAVLAAWLLGYTLAWSDHGFRIVLFAFALVGIWACLRFRQIPLPAADERPTHRPSLLSSLSCLKQDHNFTRFLSLQFLLGLSNIAGVTAIQIYVNDQQYLAASPQMAAWITGVLPPLCMFLSLRIWGGIFDRISIVKYRAVTSLAMAAGFILYPLFGLYGAITGALVWGLGRGGGQLAWSIGILSFAPRGKTAEYLAVHTFLTGVRGVMAPFIAVWALHSGMAPEKLFYLVGTLIATTALSTVVLVREPGHQ